LTNTSLTLIIIELHERSFFSSPWALLDTDSRSTGRLAHAHDLGVIFLSPEDVLESELEPGYSRMST
jgi:hypothetical protein